MGHRGVIVGGLILAMGAGVALWASLDRKATLPAGQRQVAPTKDFYPINPAMQSLQWLADESRCHVSDNAALMAGCIRERIAKVRAKALAYKERYEVLRDLDRVYFQNLRKDGLVPMTVHIRPDAVRNGLEEGLH